MMKKFVVLLACLGLAFQITGCTSKNNSNDTELAADFDSADLEKIDGEEAMEVSADDSLQSDQLPEDALGETTPAAPVADNSGDLDLESVDAPAADAPAATTDVASTDSLPADPFADTASTESVTPPAPTEDAWSTSSTSTTTTVDPATDSTTMVESTTTTDHSSTTTVVDSEPAPAKVSAPLQKVAATPWKQEGVWFNTVYFARPGDTLASISKAIYGTNKSSQLKAGNPMFKSRGVKPGDKVYYNSPNRPEDSSRVMTYHEDNGMQPEVYVAKAGDNIRTVSKNLLNYDGAWKEVWSSNSVDSKGDIAEGTELRYWRNGLVAAAPTPPPAAPVAEMPPPPEMAAPAMEPPAPPAADQFAQNDIPPPPMPDQMHNQMPDQAPPPQDFAQNEMAPPPPPPMEAMNPPTPPPQPAQANLDEETQGMDDTTTALAVVGLAAAGLAILVVVRKKRKQRELEQQAMDNTHVGT